LRLFEEIRLFCFEEEVIEDLAHPTHVKKRLANERVRIFAWFNRRSQGY